MTKLVWTAIFSACVIASTTSHAAAETYRDLTYSVPEGWGPYPGRCRGVCLLNEQSKARLDIYTLGAKSSAGAVKAIISSPVKSGEISVAGRAGAWGAGAQKVVAATDMGGDFVVFVLELSASSTEADVSAWAAVVDGASLEAGTSAPAAPEPPPADYGDADATPTRYTISITNVGNNCTARVTWDGTAVELGVGETKRLETTAGEHEITFTNNDGSTGSQRHSVPAYSRFRAGCVAPVEEARPASSDQTLAELAGLVANRKFAWEKIENGVGMYTSYSFWATTDAACPIAFSYLGLAKGLVTVEQTVNGCAHITGTVEGAPYGRTTWRLHGTWANLPGKNFVGAIDEDIWQGAMHIYTDGIALLAPYGVFDMASNKAGRWYQLGHKTD